MAIIPLRQTVLVAQYKGHDPDYNEPQYNIPIPMKCRFQESVKLVRNRHGQEVASVGAFLFDRFPQITIDDTFTYTNEHGTETTYTPIAIIIKRGLNGKPLITEVHV